MMLRAARSMPHTATPSGRSWCLDRDSSWSSRAGAFQEGL